MFSGDCVVICVICRSKLKIRIDNQILRCFFRKSDASRRKRLFVGKRIYLMSKISVLGIACQTLREGRTKSIGTPEFLKRLDRMWGSMSVDSATELSVKF